MLLDTILEKLHECREDFYREEATGLCRPDCYSWTPIEAGDVVLLISALLGIFLSVLALGFAIIGAKTVYVVKSTLCMLMHWCW